MCSEVPNNLVAHGALLSRQGSRASHPSPTDRGAGCHTQPTRLLLHRETNHKLSAFSIAESSSGGMINVNPKL